MLQDHVEVKWTKPTDYRVVSDDPLHDVKYKSKKSSRSRQSTNAAGDAGAAAAKTETTDIADSSIDNAIGTEVEAIVIYEPLNVVTEEHGNNSANGDNAISATACDDK